MSRHPLSRQGIGPAAAYEEARRQRQADAEKLERLTRESANDETYTVTDGRPNGDQRVLRAIPVIARGVAGAIPGTSPHTLADIH